MATIILDQKQKREKTEMVLLNIYNLPPIPKVMSEVLKMLENPSISTIELTKVISKDQSLVTKILSIANSPLFGLQRKVTSIDFAILVLGFGELRNIVSVLSMVESFRNKTDKYLDHKQFWLHSFLTGTATRKLAEEFKFPFSGEAFIAGFLHDMGVSIMHRYFHTNFITISDLLDQGVDLAEAETSVIGMTHEQIGNFLIERWNFPLTLCDAILHHHVPGESKNNLLLSSLVHIADYMTNKLMTGNFSWDRNLTVSNEAKEALRFNSDEEFDAFVEGYREVFAQQAESIRFMN
ncbi:MAG: HDOD domain-containing protein [Ignavibacteriaceae bacterium]